MTMRGRERAGGARYGAAGGNAQPRESAVVSKVGWHSNASSELALTPRPVDSDSCFMLARMPRCEQ